MDNSPENRDVCSGFNPSLNESALPTVGSKIIDIAPVNQQRQSIWVLLSEEGRLHRYNAETCESVAVGMVRLPNEPATDTFDGHKITPRLHVSHDGEFAGVVNDYGQFGQVINLNSGSITLELDGGDYCYETVPFSFGFAFHGGRVAVIHRTAWNRLDVSDAATGQLLTERGPTAYKTEEHRPPHYLDYFHGALYLSPQGARILDDGWVWHPVGIPAVWDIDRWLSKDVWESEDGASRREVCARDSYWDHGIAWLDEDTVAIGGIGDHGHDIVEGVRIFDVTTTGPASAEWRSDWQWAREVTAFRGPEGKFFIDGNWLYSAAESGFSRWDAKRGVRTGHIEKFSPTHHHLGTGELAQLCDGRILRWNTSVVS